MDLRQELVDEQTEFPEGTTDLLSVDTIYYPGVKEAIVKFLKAHPDAKAQIIFNAYTRRPGTYNLSYGEGNFTITKEG